jgi:hypothetical protein
MSRKRSGRAYGTLAAVHPITFSLQFRGQVAEAGEQLRKQARAPGGALVTSLTPEGPDGRFVWAPGDEEALFESTLAFHDERRFDEEGTIVFARGSTLRIRGRGRLAPSADPELRQGTVVWSIDGGDGQFEGSSGLITSNFLLSATGDLTENQLAVVFTVAEDRRAVGG